ncbi:nucleolar protein 10 [Anthonomus grandis grandis]|uniref:nucleolar protein 10 n=1 Tax=Anthonomus grandis grandis TaxID=2921223 RepID=UPI002165322F|nr:nucleolar protein 10 [Anthonomus grandis grandis]
MQVSEPNDVKIYNLSAGKSLPEWLSERKRRTLLKKNVDIKRRIELIQDFDMPGLSTTVKVSNDGNYVLATGIYKPRIKCFDVNNLSLKFERCFDSEAVTFEVLSDDYSKIVFLQCDRYVEFHAGYGRYYRLRIPKFGRDMKYHPSSCDLFVVGASPEVYRLNLERGQFMTPFGTSASEVNRCAVNPAHQLFVCGTQEGRVEAWDPRVKERVGVLDCAFTCVNENKELQGFPSVTALKFNDAVHMGVGTATGQILLYDIRSDKPFTVKDHMYGLPIKDVDFHYQQDLVYSLDSSVLKIWDKNNGKLFTSIEAATTEFNNLCPVPGTGLFFLANENTKIQTHFVPALGPAPKWASFLDSLTEELEESNAENVYDDYKFVTKEELEALGLGHLVGTKLLRAYMHGYFLDVRLYKRAKSVAEPFEFRDYRRKKIREAIDREREGRGVQIRALPKVNRELALKLMDNSQTKKPLKVNNLLQDARFKALFENPDFEVDKSADEYRLLNPVLSRLDKDRVKELKMAEEEVQEEPEERNSSLEESTDDERTWANEVRKQHKIIKREHRAREMQERAADVQKGAPLGERAAKEEVQVRFLSVGNREMTFSTRKKRENSRGDVNNKRHLAERRKLVRPAFGMRSSKKSGFKRR